MYGLFVFAAVLALFNLSTLASGFSLRAYEGSQLSESLAKLNNEMTSSNYVEAQFDGFEFSTKLISGSLSNVHIGKLNTISQYGEQQTLNVTVDDSQPKKTAVYFDLNLSLDQLYATYDYDLTFFHLIPLAGSVRMDVAENAARFIGTVFVKQPGSCEVEYNTAEITQLKDYTYNIYPRTIFNSAASVIIQFIYNHYFPLDSTVFNAYFEQSFESEEFHQKFSDIVCKIYQ